MDTVARSSRKHGQPGFSPTSPKLGPATRDDFSNILALRAGINRFVYGMLPGVSQKVSRRVPRTPRTPHSRVP
jgi:hypothetical protein